MTGLPTVGSPNYCQPVPLNFSKCRKPLLGTNIGDMPMKKLLTLRDLMPILNISEATIRRRIAESRAGIGNFPKPVTGFRRKLLFRPEDIESWMGCQQRAPPVANIEPAAQLSKRHSAALERLRSKGVKVAPKQGDEKT
jgi:predicted DNA-binding transcriptional regulator AlpA